MAANAKNRSSGIAPYYFSKARSFFVAAIAEAKNLYHTTELRHNFWRMPLALTAELCTIGGRTRDQPFNYEEMQCEA
jgi:hypothetical protein